MSTGGMSGSFPGFSGHTALMYYIGFDPNGHASLLVAALLRFLDDIEASTGFSPDLAAPSQSSRIGGGTRIGRYFLFYEADQNTLWVDDTPLLHLKNANVVLLEETASLPRSVTLRGVDTIDPDMGNVALSTGGLFAWNASFEKRLRSRLYSSRLATKFSTQVR